MKVDFKIKKAWHAAPPGPLGENLIKYFGFFGTTLSPQLAMIIDFRFIPQLALLSLYPVAVLMK